MKLNKDIHRHRISIGDPGTDWRWVTDPVAVMLQAWAMYADNYRVQFNVGILEDGVLGVAWENVGRDLRELLNGPLLIDAGTADSIIVAVFKNEGLENL